jgi:peroxiredoxin Q/BCP
MSKITRKKSSKASSGKVSRARPKSAAQEAVQESVKTKRGTPAAKSAATIGKSTAKKTAKTAAKTAPKTGPKTPRKTAAEKTAKARATAPASPARKTAATEGGPAPTFDLPRDGGGRASLADYAGRKLVIFFYPRADTPGCTKEAIDFTRLEGDFARLGTAVLGVSADPVKAQESFRNKHKLSIPLVSDEAHGMLEAYGAWGEKSMYGKSFFGILRTTVLIDASGRIAKIWRGVRVEGHADQVLAAARAL